MLSAILSNVRKNLFIYCLAALTLAGVIVSGIVYGINFFTVLPLFVSLFIMVLQSEANRYAFLIGSINSIFYAVVDFSFTLYSSAASALFISFPIQLFTFIRWNKRAYRNSTRFTKFSAEGRILLAVVSIVAFIFLNVIFGTLGSPYMLLDNVTFVISALTYVLTLLSFIEYPMLQMLGGIISLAMNIAVFADNPSRLPYIIYGIYSLICVGKGMVSVYRLYGEQRAEADKKSAKK